jgi:hypothetical protein
MARQEQPLQAQFCLAGGSSGALVVSNGRRGGPGAALVARSAPASSAGTASFTTRPAGAVGKRMLVIKPARGGGRAPAVASMSVASLSISLPFWRSKAPPAPPPKKKKTPKEVLEAAAKSALRGGLPGMGAMAIQVRTAPCRARARATPAAPGLSRPVPRPAGRLPGARARRRRGAHPPARPLEGVLAAARPRRAPSPPPLRCALTPPAPRPPAAPRCPAGAVAHVAAHHRQLRVPLRRRHDEREARSARQTVRNAPALPAAHNNSRAARRCRRAPTPPPPPPPAPRASPSSLQALKTLWSQGGVPRFYQGLAPALIQGPLSRFGDTAANTAVLTVLEDVDIPVAAKTVAASFAAGLFRIFLMPVDALKTIMQARARGAPGAAQREGAGAGRSRRRLRRCRRRAPTGGRAPACPDAAPLRIIRPGAGRGRDGPVEPGQEGAGGRPHGAVPRRAGGQRGHVRRPLPLVCDGEGRGAR